MNTRQCLCASFVCFFGLIWTGLIMSCEPPFPRELGASKTSESSVTVLYHPCIGLRGASVSEIQLLESKGNIVGDADDIVLWDVSADEPIPLSKFTIGV